MGFDATIASGGRGLDNIRDRLGAIGGDLEVITKREAGVTVRGSVPIDGATGR
jgi:signal transduction histidine kinase